MATSGSLKLSRARANSSTGLLLYCSSVTVLILAAVCQRQLSSPFSDALSIPAYSHAAREKPVDEMTSSQVLVADAAGDGVNTLWIVAPVCIAVVCILVLALIVVLTRYRKR